MSGETSEIEWPSEEAQRFWAGVNLASDLERLKREIVELYAAEIARIREERGWDASMLARNDYHIFYEEFTGLCDTGASTP
jgi:hypothetical protein